MDQIIVFIVLTLMLIFFIKGSVRYEFVSLTALLILSVFKIVHLDDVFSGFSHPAVITVASVLVISNALIKSGMVEQIVVVLNNKISSIKIKLLMLMLVTGVLSAFMNNVGALALILPIALRMAKDNDVAPSSLLMPVAFASLMGGMITLIGTPPNLIVSNYRVEAGGNPFAFFEFLPVGLSVLIIGILFVVLLGHFFIPKRDSEDEKDLFNIGEYLSEVEIIEESKLINKSIIDIGEIYKINVEVLSILRDDKKIIVPSPNTRLRLGDLLIIKTDGPKLTELIKRTGIVLKGAKLDFVKSMPHLSSDEFELIEVVLRDDSLLINRTAYEVLLRNRFNVNLIAVSRKGQVSLERLKTFRFKSGDILLLQAPISRLQDIFQDLSCLPLAKREVKLDPKRPKHKEYLPLLLFIFAIIITTLGILPVQLSFTSVAVILVLSKTITAREFYDSIEWPTILLLGTLLPLGSALTNSGASDTIANVLLRLSSLISAQSILVILMIITIIITNLISGTATAVLMGPIALSLASAMGVSPDAYLVGVAIASTTAYMTPIAHQSNMLVMGPGSYEFKDYFKLGFPLTILSLLVSVPIIIYIWPI